MKRPVAMDEYRLPLVQHLQNYLRDLVELLLPACFPIDRKENGFLMEFVTRLGTASNFVSAPTHEMMAQMPRSYLTLVSLSPHQRKSSICERCANQKPMSPHLSKAGGKTTLGSAPWTDGNGMPSGGHI